MRPIRVRMSAFGPYAELEEIDFDRLNGQNIFLITGPTGSGKTTIFDAISFALFGTASGNERENDSLRSDFADDDRETFVEMEFMFKKEVYMVKRSPAQWKKKKRGEGFTQQGADAYLYLPDGATITNTKEVTSKIEELLGINKEQFKQIVMLAQGEFKKLLLADSKDREGIFRKIFGTHDYQKMQLRLKDKASILKKDVDRVRAEISTNLKGIRYKEEIGLSEYTEFSTTLKTLENILEEDKGKKKELEEKLTTLRKKKDKLTTAYIKGEESNKLIKEKIELTNKISIHDKDKNEYNNREILIEQIRLALNIKPIEENYIVKNRERISKTEERDRLLNENRDLEAELKVIQNNVIKEEAKEVERQRVEKEIVILKEKYRKLQELESKKSIVNTIEKNHNNILIELDNLKNKRLIDTNEVENKELQIKDILDAEKKMVFVDNLIIRKKEVIDKLLKLFSEAEKLNDIRNRYLLGIQQFKKIESEFKITKDTFEKLEMRFRKGQAGILALTLEDNKPCPVCGSTNHPNIASIEDDVPTEEKLKIEQEKFEKIKEENDELLNKLKVLNQEIQIKTNEVITPLIEEIEKSSNITLILDDELLSNIKLTGKEFRGELNKLEAEKRELQNIINSKANIESIIKKLKIEIDKITLNIEDKEKERLNIFGKLQSEKENIKILVSEMPKDIDSIDKLNLKIIELEDIVEKGKKQLKSIKDKEALLSKSLSAVVGKIESTNKIIDELIESERVLKVKLENSLNKSFDNREKYDELKRNTQSDIERLQADVEMYKSEAKSLKDRYDGLENKINNIKEVNLIELSEEINDLSKEEKVLDKEIRDNYAVYENNKSRYKSIKKLADDILIIEKQYRIIGQLAEVSNGKKAPYITFESYVLATYFQQIIDAANIRLKKMTSERFLLKRKEDKGKGSGQKGLDLQVFDNYTGKIRDVKTLSGGESFKASLSLALGLSDVIQGNVGGIELDTMFIDEGFGTLDPESLDNAINCLIDLQRGGRLVGIISHVPELKERVEAKLEVSTSAKGSKAKFI